MGLRFIDEQVPSAASVDFLSGFRKYVYCSVFMVLRDKLPVFGHMEMNEYNLEVTLKIICESHPNI